MDNKDKALDEMSLEELEAVSEAQGTDAKNVEVDTETETPVEDNQTTDVPVADPETETPDYVDLFNKSGLETQYPGGISEMISRMPDTNKYMRELQEDNKVFRDDLIERAKVKETVVEQTPEDFQDSFFENPDKTLRDKGFVGNDELEKTNKRLDTIENDILYNDVANDIGKYDELSDISNMYRLKTEPKPGQNATWDAFLSMVDKYPGMKNLLLPTKLELFFDMNKSTDKTKPPVAPLSIQKKNAAKTTTLNKSGGDGLPDFDNMTADQILDHAKKHGQYD